MGLAKAAEGGRHTLARECEIHTGAEVIRTLKLRTRIHLSQHDKPTASRTRASESACSTHQLQINDLLDPPANALKNILNRAAEISGMLFDAV